MLLVAWCHSPWSEINFRSCCDEFGLSCVSWPCWQQLCGFCHSSSVPRAVPAVSWAWLQLSSTAGVSASAGWHALLQSGAGPDPALLPPPLLCTVPALHCQEPRGCGRGSRRCWQHCLPVGDKGLWLIPEPEPPTLPWCSACGALCSSSPQQLGQQDWHSVTTVSPQLCSPKLRLQDLSGAESWPWHSQFLPAPTVQLGTGDPLAFPAAALSQQVGQQEWRELLSAWKWLWLCSSCFLWVLLYCKLAKPPLARKRGLQYLWQTLEQISK